MIITFQLLLTLSWDFVQIMDMGDGIEQRITFICEVEADHMYSLC